MDQAGKGYADPSYLRVLADLLGKYKRRSYELMGVKAGSRVLDVGCGPATDTVPLAKLVGPTGSVVGVDRDPAMVAEADRLTVEAGIASWVEHRVADALSLPFEANAFDACHSERLFQHLLEPECALSEMIRVTRPGGWIVTLDTDFGSASLALSEANLERRLVQVLPERLLNNGYIARMLYGHFRQYGLKEVTVEICPVYLTNYALVRRLALLDRVEEEAVRARIISSDELVKWHTCLESADQEGTFFATWNMIAVAGRRA